MKTFLNLILVIVSFASLCSICYAFYLVFKPIFSNNKHNIADYSNIGFYFILGLLGIGIIKIIEILEKRVEN